MTVPMPRPLGESCHGKPCFLAYDIDRLARLGWPSGDPDKETADPFDFTTPCVETGARPDDCSRHWKEETIGLRECLELAFKPDDEAAREASVGLVQLTFGEEDAGHRRTCRKQRKAVNSKVRSRGRGEPW